MHLILGENLKYMKVLVTFRKSDFSVRGLRLTYSMLDKKRALKLNIK